ISAGSPGSIADWGAILDPAAGDRPVGWVGGGKQTRVNAQKDMLDGSPRDVVQAGGPRAGGVVRARAREERAPEWAGAGGGDRAGGGWTACEPAVHVAPSGPRGASCRGRQWRDVCAGSDQLRAFDQRSAVVPGTY